MIDKRFGVTLIEVVIAAAILALAFIPIVNLISSSATTTVKVGNYAKASDLLAKFMEEVKHVPMKVYEEKIPQLLAGEEATIPEEFYQDTLKSFTELKKEDKEFWLENKIKAEVNNYKQIVELGISAQITWKEKGNKEATSQPDRSLRDYALIFNSEAKLD